ncbi:ABC transporter permease [uncultured Methanobrevibacter sp.]|uniref:ABC transporter permease n=1 Tax=uncultured Methanobrevibacter sp. TaxID=253161 RepID=UPI0025EEDE78|nr:ABC transporter permease [uncultured Methanobrevibacter sp.]
MFDTWDEKRFLLKQLVKRDFTNKYKESVLGIIWSFLNPLCIMIIFTVIFSVLFRQQINGRLIYDFFVAATSGAMQSIRRNRSILTKIFVPRYMFAVSSICYEFINFLISLVILFGVMFVTGQEFHLMILASIIPMIFVVIMIVGVGLILAVLNTYFSDVGHFYTIFTIILMYASALFYPMEIVPADIQIIFTSNPLYIAITCLRDTMMYNVFPEISSLLYLAIFSIMLFGVGFLLFRIHEKKLVLRL